jgi:hypothetical protein
MVDRIIVPKEAVSKVQAVLKNLSNTPIIASLESLSAECGP